MPRKDARRAVGSDLSQRVVYALLAILLGVGILGSCGDDAREDDSGRVGADAGVGDRRSNHDNRSTDSATPDLRTDAGSGIRGVLDAGRDAAFSDSASPFEPPDRAGCPTLEFPNFFVLPSCCTSRGMCGIDTSTVGGPGCLDLATAAERARMAGASAVFPAPRVCDDSDGGAQEDAGF